MLTLFMSDYLAVYQQDSLAFNAAFGSLTARVNSGVRSGLSTLNIKSPESVQASCSDFRYYL